MKKKYKLCGEYGTTFIVSANDISYVSELVRHTRDELNRISFFDTEDGKRFFRYDFGDLSLREIDNTSVSLEISPEEKVVIKKEDTKQMNKISEKIEKPKNVYQKLYFRKRS